MKAACYLPGGRIVVQDVPEPALPPGGLLVRTEACGLCSGELMAWYMEQKAPHVLGHEVAGIVVESADARYPVGSRVAPHHHAACLECEECRRGNYVFCEQWKRTHLVPGGMTEKFAVPAENLTDAKSVGEMRAVDGALIEPLGCVVKSVRRAGLTGGERCAVIGLGVMGLMHLLLLGGDAVGYELAAGRREWAANLGLDARAPHELAGKADAVFMCPGTAAALRFALDIAAPGATIVLFAPFPPGETTSLDLGALYFRDYTLVNSYSCGPVDTDGAYDAVKDGRVTADKVVSHFIDLDDLPTAYADMKAGRILKAMVVAG
jgi:L-iditol 2-dehydrogenase